MEGNDLDTGLTYEISKKLKRKLYFSTFMKSQSTGYNL